MCGVPSESEGSAMCSDQEKHPKTDSTPPGRCQDDPKYDKVTLFLFQWSYHMI